MNFVLSIFLCLAMILGGTGELPAEPEAAALCVRNISLESGGRSWSLDPALRLSAAAGADRAGLQLALENGGQSLLPIRAELSPDGLRASFGTIECAYSMPAADVEGLLGFEGDVQSLLEIVEPPVSQLCALAGDAIGGGDRIARCGEALWQAARDAFGGESEPASVELDGRTLAGERTTLELDGAGLIALLDALRGCGAPELESLSGALLKFINLENETEAESFAALGDPGGIPGGLALTVTSAREDSGSFRTDLELGESELGALRFRATRAARGDGSRLDARVYLNGPIAGYNRMLCTLSVDAAPGETHAELGAVWSNLSLHDTPVLRNNVLNLTLDSAVRAGQRDVQIAARFHGGRGPRASLDAGWTAREEPDGGATASVSLAAGADGAELGRLRFDLDFRDGGSWAPFAGMEPRELRFSTLWNPYRWNDFPDLDADILNFCMDAALLADDPSVQSFLGALRALAGGGVE